MIQLSSNSKEDDTIALQNQIGALLSAFALKYGVIIHSIIASPGFIDPSTYYVRILVVPKESKAIIKET